MANTVGSPRVPTELTRRLVGTSAAIGHVREMIVQVASTAATVLLLGESGTGKEVIAQAIHDNSMRAQKPFIPLNCGAIPGELLESELFGHEKGAFTGAVSARKGRFEMAEGGTLFLDEIGDMPFEMQVKLLRVLQERTFERVGGNKPMSCDVRVIAATHQNLESKVENGEFRADLFYRLNVFPIEIPPLRERAEDIIPLIDRFLNEFVDTSGSTCDIEADAIKHLMHYEWPGNVRELGNLLERLSILHPGKAVHAADLPAKYRSHGLSLDLWADQQSEQASLLDVPSGFVPEFSADSVEAGADNRFPDVTEEREDLSGLFAPTPTVPLPSGPVLSPDEPFDLKGYLADIEKDLIVQALEQTDWVNAQAAKLLMLQRTTLVEKIRKYQIERPDEEF